MKKIILIIAVFAATLISVSVFAAQTNSAQPANTEVTDEDYVKVEFQNLPEETQELLLKAFEGYEMKAIYQHIETNLLKVIVVKDEVEQTFIQNHEGNFEEQK
jgi:hypothetical protein